KNGSREYLFLSGNSSFVSIYIDGRDCCQTGQFSQDVADGALTFMRLPFPPAACTFTRMLKIG
ncbi:hypothetical protein CRD97_21260, partial [Escherichia coli]